MAKRGVSLSEVHRSVGVPKGANIFKRMFAFFGPAYLVSVGYMDPGNWATDLEGGARFGYQLLWVLVMSNAAAILLQTLSARLGIVTGRDLAQACRDNYPRSVNYMLWFLAEIGIAACDLAEVLGTAIGLNLLFGLPLLWGVLLTGADTFLFLAIQNLGVRKFEAFILGLITVIGGCFLFEVIASTPDWKMVASGFVPFAPAGSLYIIMGIIGATVMPHNLYLHSALVQTRAYDNSWEGKKQACKYNFIDSTIALNAAFFVNAAILITAAATFHRNGILVTELQQAHQLLSPLLGTALAGIAFAVALVCAGQASTITGTLAGQIIMEGYLHLKIRPVLRRLITRMVAIVPAALTIYFAGDGGSYKLLILSQVILSMQLPFAIIPLIQFTSNRETMGDLAVSGWLKVLSWGVAVGLVGLNIKLIGEQVADWAATSAEPVWIYGEVIPFLFALLFLLLYITIKPYIDFKKAESIPAWKTLKNFIRPNEDHLDLDTPEYKRVGVALSHTQNDKAVLSHALPIAKHHDAVLCLLHVVEGASGSVFGRDAFDAETRHDEDYLNQLAASLGHRGVEVEVSLGYGNVSKEIIRMAQEDKIDLLVMGGHGHGGWAGMLFGATVAPVRHGLQIPIVVVR